MKSSRFCNIPITLFVVLLSACASNPPDKIVLLPQANGAASAVIVESKAGRVVLDKPYATTDISSNAIVESRLDKTAVEDRYKAVMDALPARPRSHVVYFELGNTQLRADSYQELNSALNDMKEMAFAELTIIGHTDSSGNDAINNKLSEQRARKIRDIFIQNGVREANIETVGRGSRDPIVKPGSGKSESINRRVEIRIK